MRFHKIDDIEGASYIRPGCNFEEKPLSIARRVDVAAEKQVILVLSGFVDAI
jgi:hypothetical protein